LQKKVIADSSVVLNLAIIGKLDLLKTFFGKVLIPGSVYKETVINGKGKPGADEIEQAVKNKWIEIVEVGESALTKLLEKDLDKGESACIAYAIDQKCEWILLDEQDAREVADLYGLKKTGIIGLLMRARLEGKIENLKELLDRLRDEADFRISEELFQMALKDTGEIK